jgi:hypothetical protein
LLLVLSCTEYGPVLYLTDIPRVRADSAASVAVFAQLYAEQRVVRGFSALTDHGRLKIDRQGVRAFWCDETARQVRFLGLMELAGMGPDKDLTIASVASDSFTLVFVRFDRSDTAAYRVQVGGGVAAIANPVVTDPVPVQLQSFCQAAYERLQADDRARTVAGFAHPPSDSIFAASFNER